MKLEHLSIKNFRALNEVEIPLSQFGCIIGENNAGKSSVLHAIVLALTGSTPRKLSEADFYDRTKPIRIELRLAEITAEDLSLIQDDGHRASFASDVVDGRIAIVRHVGVDLKSSLLIARRSPENEHLTDAALKEVMKKKSGQVRIDAVLEVAPELEGWIQGATTAQGILDGCATYIKTLSDDQFVVRDGDLKTGIEAGIKSFLPEPIYIEAVKDVAGEMKTSDSATFGKLLKLLLEEVADEFNDLQERFSEVQRRFSRVMGSDGTAAPDERLEPVKKIEETIERLVQESFPGVALKMNVPVPELKTIFSSAEVSIDDGHEGPITGKGDGLKRTVAFAILRAYTMLRAEGFGNGASQKTVRRMNVLLFEEPELYLHPKGQRQLFQALELFSLDYPVLVTTHSPVFFSPEATKTFTKMRKIPTTVGLSRLSEAFPIDLNDFNQRSAFEIICHENNESAFFANAVVLVEGDSDSIVFPHLSKVFNPAWDHIDCNVSYIVVGGKTNIGKYRDFFSNFKIDVHVLCDLDTILDGFEHIDPSKSYTALRSNLLQAVNSLVPPSDGITSTDARKLAGRGSLRGHWNAAENAYRIWDGSADGFAPIKESLDSFFMKGQSKASLAILKEADGEVHRLKSDLLSRLRDEAVYVLTKGDLEDYYGSVDRNGFGKNDKVRLAMHVISQIEDLEQFKGLHEVNADRVMDELKDVMSRIYGSYASQN